jgi:tripartite-type tricarboxylate transporter receptor subunit TctC
MYRMTLKPNSSNCSFFQRIAFIICMLVCTLAFAEYPDRAIKLIVPYAPGGSSDIVGRQVAQFLSQEIGQSIIVENIGGGGGSIGVQRAASSTPDGYTLLLGANSELIINKLLKPDLPYEVSKDFRALASIGAGPIVIIGKKNLNANSFEEVLALTKSTPGGLSFGSSGNGTIQHLVGEFIKLKTKVDMTHVPYKGAGPLAADVAGNQIDLGIVTLAAAKPLIEANKVKVFLLSSEIRSEFAPNIAAMSETSALTNTSIETWYGVFAPIKTSQAITSLLERKLKLVADNPEMAKNLALQAIAINQKTPKELQTYLMKESEKFKSIIQEAHINIQ